MGIVTLQMDFAGSVGINPRLGRMVSTDTLATITAPGYLNKNANSLALNFLQTDVIFGAYTNNSGGISVSQFTVSIAGGGVITLVVADTTVVLPTKVNHIATYVNTSGGLSEDATTAINGGNIQAGLSGTAGTLASFPATASKGSLVIAGVANTGNTNVTLSNVAHGQATVYSIPDAGNAAGRILNAATATPFTSGHLISASGTSGLTTDSGVLASAVQLNTNIKAGHTIDIGGGGAGPITVNLTGVTTASVIVGTIISSSNAVEIEKIAPGTGTFAVTFSADPGASAIVSYVAFLAAQ